MFANLFKSRVRGAVTPISKVWAWPPPREFLADGTRLSLAEVRHERDQSRAKCFGISSGYGRVYTTFEVQIDAVGERDVKVGEQALLFGA